MSMMVDYYVGSAFVYTDKTTHYEVVPLPLIHPSPRPAGLPLLHQYSFPLPEAFPAPTTCSYLW